MPSPTIENYAKAIYQLTGGQTDRSAATGSLASLLRVSPSSVTSMFKTLQESGLAEHRPYEGVKLTDKGVKLALRVLRRHRLIELFLVRTLDLSWDEVHEEAEHMEHAVSDLLIDRIDAFLEFPELDPHGDPIPKSDGSVATSKHTPLDQCPCGMKLTLERVLGQDPEFLRYLSDAGLGLGTSLSIVSENRPAGTVIVEVAGNHVTLGRDSAKLLLMGSPNN